MSRSSSAILGMIALALLLAAPGASAQGNPRITVFGGGSFVKADRSFTVNGDNFKSEFVNGGNIRLRGSFDLTGHWTAEADYAFSTNNFRVTELGTTPQQRNFGTRIHDVDFSLVRFWTSSGSRIRPYLTAGLGLARYSPTDAAKAQASSSGFIDEPAQIEASNQLSFPVGGGVELGLTRWFGARLEVKDYLSPIPRFGVPQSSSGTGGAFFPVDGVAHNVEAAVGIVFHLTPQH